CVIPINLSSFNRPERPVRQLRTNEIDLHPPSRVVHGVDRNAVRMLPFAIAVRRVPLAEGSHNTHRVLPNGQPFSGEPERAKRATRVRWNGMLGRASLRVQRLDPLCLFPPPPVPKHSYD